MSVEVEEVVYGYQDSGNGANAVWCSGSSCLVRIGNDLFASGIEVIPHAKPLNNCRWLLFQRTASGWRLWHKDLRERTREPCPLVGFSGGRLLQSVNPARTTPDAYSGPAEPQLLEFSAADPVAPPKVWSPRWSAAVVFTEHSYRNLAVDRERGELIVFHNLNYDGAYWSFLDHQGAWSARGHLLWPVGEHYHPPQPLRLCYYNVFLDDRAAYVWGASDTAEPVDSWKKFKFELSGQEWAYVFRYVFFSWTPDVTCEPFRPWLEIANVEPTAGYVRNCDLWVSSDGAAHLLWLEHDRYFIGVRNFPTPRADDIEQRFHEKFFPHRRRTYTLNYAVLREGQVVGKWVLARGGEESSQLVEIPKWGRFQVLPDGRLFVFFSVDILLDGANSFTENRCLEIQPNGDVGGAMKLPLRHPFTEYFFTATPRAGSPPSNMMELLGECRDEPRTVRYARIQVG